MYLREEMGAPLCKAMARGALDAVLLAMPWACGDVTTVRLFDDAVYVAFNKGARDGPPPSVAPDAFQSDRLLLLEDGNCLRGQALAAYGRPELRADPDVRGTSLGTLVQMVANGLGMTLLPRMAFDAGIFGGHARARVAAGGARPQLHDRAGVARVLAARRRIRAARGRIARGCAAER